MHGPFHIVICGLKGNVVHADVHIARAGAREGARPGGILDIGRNCKVGQVTGAIKEHSHIGTKVLI